MGDVGDARVWIDDQKGERLFGYGEEDEKTEEDEFRKPGYSKDGYEYILEAKIRSMKAVIQEEILSWGLRNGEVRNFGLGRGRRKVISMSEERVRILTKKIYQLRYYNTAIRKTKTVILKTREGSEVRELLNVVSAACKHGT